MDNEHSPADRPPADPIVPVAESSEPAIEPSAQAQVQAETAPPDTPALDLDGIQLDLADVEVALARLDAGTYWTDEVTGVALPAELLAEHPTARRATV